MFSHFCTVMTTGSTIDRTFQADVTFCKTRLVGQKVVLVSHALVTILVRVNASRP